MVVSQRQTEWCERRMAHEIVQAEPSSDALPPTVKDQKCLDIFPIVYNLRDWTRHSKFDLDT